MAQIWVSGDMQRFRCGKGSGICMHVSFGIVDMLASKLVSVNMIIKMLTSTC